MKNSNKNILPDNIEEAFEVMIDITHKAILMTNEESNAIALGNDLDFLEASKKKRKQNEYYQRSAQEFLCRYKELSSYKGGATQTFLNLQKELSMSASINMSLLKPRCKSLM